jgi:hypothetical protein
VTCYETNHFLALSNAEQNFTESRLRNCEVLYVLFSDHFRRKGFPFRVSAVKLMVAIFDNQTGFEAYLGRKTSPLITGIYHPDSNRLVMYDYGQNKDYLAKKEKAESDVKRLRSQLDRQRYLDTVHRHAQEIRAVANIGTIMHEVAHQLSYNCGMLNRDGDVPLWLAEGLACYCEATTNSTWQGIGEPNPERLATLAPVLRSHGKLHGLRDLLASDAWLTGKNDSQAILLGYAQSWALFRMLIEEQPQALRAYLTLIHPRQTAERRLADFQQAFGSDLARLERRHTDYIQHLVDLYVPVSRAHGR